MAQGLAYLHSRDIVHADFKAANVLISEIGQSIICDFGLSHLKLDIMTHSQQDAEAQLALAGTMRWKSPERLAGGGPTFKADVYAFAMAIFEVYSGQIPFGFKDDLQVSREVQSKSAPLSTLVEVQVVFGLSGRHRFQRDCGN